MDLGRLLRPRSVAVVGASERPGSYGGEALVNLLRLQFDGSLFAVNPGKSFVHGIACVPALSDLPEAPDAVIVAIPAAAAQPRPHPHCLTRKPLLNLPAPVISPPAL